MLGMSMKVIVLRYDAMGCGRCESKYGSTINNEVE